jgi:hypothetical protein
MLKGIYWIAESLLEGIKAHPDAQDYSYSLNEISLMQDFADEGMMGQRELRSVFSEIGKCSVKPLQFPKSSE